MLKELESRRRSVPYGRDWGAYVDRMRPYITFLALLATSRKEVDALASSNATAVNGADDPASPLRSSRINAESAGCFCRLVQPRQEVRKNSLRNMSSARTGGR